MTFKWTLEDIENFIDQAEGLIVISPVFTDLKSILQMMKLTEMSHIYLKGMREPEQWKE